MAGVTGIGGFFFRAGDPGALQKWYARHLGVGVGVPVWHQQAGPTVFSPFPADTDYFGDTAKSWMINFRVDDLVGLMADLRAAGIAVETNPDWDSEIGRFARIHDPEGNPIELWEPAEG